MEYDAKTCIDAADSIDDNEAKLNRINSLSARARGIRDSINRKGEWYHIFEKAKRLGIDVTECNQDFQNKLKKYLINCLGSENNIKSRDLWNDFRSLFKVTLWSVADNTEKAETIESLKDVAYNLGDRFTPKVNINRIDDECEKYVENIVKHYKLDTQMAVTDDYYTIGKEILDTKNSNRDILKLRNESPNMIKLLKICWVMGYSNAKSERDGKIALLLKYVLFFNSKNAVF